MTRPALATATVHGTGWQQDAAGEWSTTPGYCWCGTLARSCPEPKRHVSAADTMATPSPEPAALFPDGVDFFGLSL